MRFKVGDRVKVIKKVQYWKVCSWNDTYMDKTIGRVYKIILVREDRGDYRLETKIEGKRCDDYNFYYPQESLQRVNEQLLFSFMKGS